MRSEVPSLWCETQPRRSSFRGVPPTISHHLTLVTSPHSFVVIPLGLLPLFVGFLFHCPLGFIAIRKDEVHFLSHSFDIDKLGKLYVFPGTYF